MIIIFCSILMLLPATVGYSFGPPVTVCDSMTPNHHPSSPQTSSSPYRIRLPADKNTYSENEEIEVILEGTGGKQFKGFLIQARPSADNYTTFGKIAAPYPTNTKNPCESQGVNKNVALAHTSATLKDNVTFTWIAPATDVGDIVFVFTVVEQKLTFWVKSTSSVPLTYKSNPVPTANSPTTNTPSNKINRDPECEMTKSCYPAASECSMDCDFLVSWKVTGDEDVEFTLQRKTTSNNYWIGIGFSDDASMGNDSVVECVSNSGSIDVKISFNKISPPYSNERPASKDQFGVNLLDGSYSNDILSCTFARKINASLADGFQGTEDTFFFDLKTEWYLFVAHGTATSGVKNKHVEFPKISPDKIDFLTVGPEKPTTPAMSDTGINRDPECEMTKSCYPAASECSLDCDYLVSWKVTGDEDVEFTLQRKTTSNNYWIGIGFSDDARMGNDSVVECVSSNGSVDVKISFNNIPPSKTNERPANKDQFGVNLLHGTSSNDILSCTFARKINASLADAFQGTEDTFFFDLETEWHLFVAHGTATSGAKNKHVEFPKISTDKIDFLTVGPEKPTTPAMSDSGVIKKDSKCGESRGCYHNCDSSDTCGFLLTWVENGDNIDFILTCKRSGNNVYCAIGWSKDKEMGDDSVFECVSTNGQVSIYVSYNEGRNNYRLSKGKFGISNDAATYTDGILECTFSRKKTAALAESNSQRKKRAREPSASTFFDANDDFYLFYADGTSVGGFINQHNMQPKVSSDKADFQSSMDIGATTIANTLVKVHGILMMFAWLFLARLGVFIASHYKNVWPDGMEWFGQKRWFILHRSMMVLTFLVAAAAFIIIFVHAGGYSEVGEGNFKKSHPIIGIITMCLVTINPILALFRPHPGTPRRPYFNFAHISIGITAYVCAVVNVFSGFEMGSANVPYSAKIVVWVYLVWVGLIEIASHIYECKNKKASKGETYEMKPAADYVSETPSQSVSKFKIGILCLHAITMLVLVIAVCVIVWKGKGNNDDE